MRSYWQCAFGFLLFLVLTNTLVAQEEGVKSQPVVTIHLLRSHPSEKAVGRFWIDWNNKWADVIKSKRVEGDGAREIVQLLSEQLLPKPAENFCGHHPIYGVVARNNEGTVLKTSLCFKCGTWVKPGLRLSISGNSNSEDSLLSRLREEVEIPDWDPE